MKRGRCLLRCSLTSCVMESLTEQIAGEIGKKWVQLFTRLGLGDKARERYRIVVEHKDDPKLCTRDTIRLTYYDRQPT